MQINGPSHIHGAHQVNPAEAARFAQPTQETSGLTGGDEVSISVEADLLARINELPDIRQDRVDQIRAEIAAGTYETDEKLDTAIARLLDEIA